tara:strand:- start:427 stop:600 length:174 start_codon:yes stop_codon:yes gene_type:complete
MKIKFSEEVTVREYVPQTPIRKMKEEHWLILFSNKRNAYYYFNRKTGKSYWKMPKET